MSNQTYFSISSSDASGAFDGSNSTSELIELPGLVQMGRFEPAAESAGTDIHFRGILPDEPFGNP
jgi:hypothetical protein